MDKGVGFFKKNVVGKWQQAFISIVMRAALQPTIVLLTVLLLIAMFSLVACHGLARGQTAGVEVQPAITGNNTTDQAEVSVYTSGRNPANGAESNQASSESDTTNKVNSSQVDTDINAVVLAESTLTSSDDNAAPVKTKPDTAGEKSIRITGDGIDGEIIFSLSELLALPGAVFEHIYSTINNWPVEKFYAGRGIRVETILAAAGVLDAAQSVTFRSYDSYEVTLTRRQLLEDKHYFFPQVAEGSGENAEEVYPIISYEYKAGSSDLTQASPAELCLIIGQRNHFEHTNPAFVENLAEIIISASPPKQWEAATIFPVSGRIPAGESIKLQHPEFGLVKMFYTLDGSEPTELSSMYNPSTYQPELNRPIQFEKSAVLKVLVTGFGRENSPVAEFGIEVQ